MGQWTPVSGDLALLGLIAEAGGLSRAAQASGRPKQTLSRRLAEMEAAAGTPLFDRTGRGLRPTPLALRLLPQSAVVREAERAAALALAAWRNTPAGALRVSAPACFAQSIVAPAVGRLLTHYPALEVTLKVDHDQADPLAAGMDLAVTMGKPRSPDLLIRLIARLPTAIYAPTATASMAVDAVLNLPRVMVAQDVRQSWTIGQQGNVIILAQPALALVNDPEAGLRLLLQLKHAIGLLPRFMGDPEVEQGRLIRVLPDQAGPDVRFYLALPAGRTQMPSVRALVGEITKVMRLTPGWTI